MKGEKYPKQHHDGKPPVRRSASEVLSRLEEAEKELAYHQEWYKKARENYDRDRKFWGQADDGEMRVASDAVSTTSQEIKSLKQILSQSTPLIPELEKAFDEGFHKGYGVGQGDARNHPLALTLANHIHEERQDYISNLKLDI